MKPSAHDVGFITKARKVHGDKYDYSRVTYIGIHGKVAIGCSVHGWFEQRAHNHLAGTGCPSCGVTRSNTGEFITKARKVHGDKYEYKLVDYVVSNMPVGIMCLVHGQFDQTPDIHLTGAGCPRCGRKQLDTTEFIARAREIHGARYDYSRVIYTKMRELVEVVCTTHGPFVQAPYRHIRGQGCPRCGRPKRLTTEAFVVNAKLTHGDTYDYSQVTYVNSQQKVKIVCQKHGLFEQTPNGHLSGRGCPTCSGKQQSTTEEFITKARKLHGDKYDYSRVEYTTGKTKVVIGCDTHGVFTQSPCNHLRGNGCPTCSGKQRSTTEEFITKARKVHGDKYDYSRAEYVNTSTNVTICCTEHGPFVQTPTNHVQGTGCPLCVMVGYSEKSIRWLERISKEQNINIQHAENGGEFKIPGTKWKADGYCVETNTIYEFHGDVYHGNPAIFGDMDICHPFNRTVTAADLYHKTLQREETIRSLGYNLVVIWESVYDSPTS